MPVKTTRRCILLLLAALATLLVGNPIAGPGAEAALLPRPEVQSRLAVPPSADRERPAEIRLGGASTGAVTLSLAELGYDADETLRGAVAVREYQIILPLRSKLLAGSRFFLHFSHSPALTGNSSLAVDWNGRRLASVLLGADNAVQGVLEVILPPESTLSGRNVLRLEALLSISPDYCEDTDNPAVWATVHRSSYFDLEMAPVEVSPDLGRFPEIFVDASPFSARPLTLVLPTEPTAAELTAAATVAARLGQASTDRMPDWRVTLTDDWGPPAADSDAIVVGRLDRLSAVRSLAPDGALADLEARSVTQPDAALVWQAVLTPTNAMALVVTGATDAGVRQAGYALANQNVTALWRGAYAVVTDVPPIAVETVPGRGIPFTFRQLGYGDVVARGTYEQVAQYVLRLPADWQRTSQATLQLHFLHSALLHPSRSSLNLVLNDIPIGSIALTEDSAEDAWRSFRLPLRLLRPGPNRLNVISSIRSIPTRDGRVYADEDCRYDYAREAWVVIFADSVVEVPGTSGRPPADLAFYPAAFVGADDLAELVFVLPDPPTDADIFSLVAVATSVGHASAAHSLTPEVQVATAPSASIATDRRHRILIGLPSRNGAIAAINEYLPQPFDLASDTPRRGMMLPEVVTGDARPGYVLAAAPAEGAPVLIVTGGSYEGLQWAAASLSDPGQRARLTGPLAVSPAAGQLVAPTGGDGLAESEGGIEIAVGARALTGLVAAGLPVSAIWVWLGCLAVAVGALLLRVYVLRWRLQKENGDPGAALITVLSPALLGLWLILALSAVAWLSLSAVEFGLIGAVMLLAIGGGCLQSRWRFVLLIIGAASLVGAAWGLVGVNPRTLTLVGAGLALMGLTGWLSHSLCRTGWRWMAGSLGGVATPADDSGTSDAPEAGE